MKNWRAKLQDVSTKLMAEAWKCHREGLPLEGELADLVYCMEHHDEWSEVWDNLSTAQDTGIEIEAEDGSINPLLHIHLDGIVKRQLGGNDPKEIRFVYNLLDARGFEEFDAYHVIARALVEEIWGIMAGKHQFDEARYISKARQYANEEIRRREKGRRGKGEGG